MELNILNEVAALQRLTIGQLRQRFADVFGEVTAASNRTWLVKRIAWRLQALAEGDLSERARRRAAELAHDADLRLNPPHSKTTPAIPAEPVSVPALVDPRLPPPGTILTRPYKGQQLHVQVLTEGFAGVRRLARAMQRRGNAGRKRQRGRPSKARQAARAAAEPTLKEQAGFILAHRFLIVKKTRDLDKQQWDDLIGMFEYLPQLRTLWRFAGEVRALFEKEGRVQMLWKRRAALLRQEKYQAVPELVEAMKLLESGKFKKMVAFVYSVSAQKVRTNNHVERANRRIRFAEKVRYKWRRRKWVLRFVLLALDRWWRQAARAFDQSDQITGGGPEKQTFASKAAG